ncbi:MAG: ATP-binding protein, partial [Propionibacteriaceae bacterium]|nr:ATP-binding protein [Propionibacteriaceae bacterium]
QNTPLSGRLGPEVFYIRTLVDLCGFVALYAWQGQRLQQRAKAEVAAIQSLLRGQHEQYLQSKRSIDTVNRAYHDMKHQLGVIRAESDPGRRDAHIAELEASLAGYGQVVKTGNEVVDVILTAKTMACAERGIDLTTVADGAAVAFVSTADLCTILGNALDNAIEAAGQLGDPARRLIKLSLFSQSQFAVLTVENSFRGKLTWEEGEIVTSHADRDHHGFGLKSIKYVADRYGGSMTAQADGEWFVLRVLLPVPAAAAV